MITLLEELLPKIKSQWDLSQGEISKSVYSILYTLTSEAIRIDQKAPSGPASDELTNLKIENANLKAQLGALSQMAGIVEGTRTALRQREDAPVEEMTAVMLPVYAARLRADLDAKSK